MINHSIENNNAIPGHTPTGEPKPDTPAQPGSAEALTEILYYAGQVLRELHQIRGQYDKCRKPEMKEILLLENNKLKKALIDLERMIHEKL